MTLVIFLVIALAAGCSSPTATSSESKFLEKPMDMTILVQAGGAADVIGRQLAEGASKELGQPIVCNVRTGGGGAVGYQYVLGFKPDGYNMVWNSTSAIENALGVKFKHIPMDSKTSVTAVLGDKADAMVNMAFDAIPHVQAGEMKALAIIGTERLEQMPDVPAMKELGYDVDLMMWCSNSRML